MHWRRCAPSWVSREGLLRAAHVGGGAGAAAGSCHPLCHLSSSGAQCSGGHGRKNGAAVKAPLQNSVIGACAVAPFDPAKTGGRRK